MQQALRPYATAGIALVGAGLIAVTPVVAPLPDLHQVRDVALTADGSDASGIIGGFLEAWKDTFDSAKDNLTTLGTAYADAFSDLKDALTSSPHLDGKELFNALTFLGGDQKNFTIPMSDHTLDATNGLGHTFLFEFLTSPVAPDQGLPDGGLLVSGGHEGLIPLVNFLASPLSGVLIGMLGPMLSPWVALINSVEAIIGDFGADGGGLTAALQELVNIPANMVDGFLNGATLNLDALIPLVGSTGLLGDAELSSLNLTLGGLLSPGNAADGVGGVAGGVGGSIFNELGLEASAGGFPLSVDGFGIGEAGALASMIDIIAQSLAGELPTP